MATTSHVVVLDANILIPLVLPASRATRLFLRLDLAGWIIAASPQILDEVAEKMRTKQNLRRWLKLDDADIDDFLTALPTLVRLVPGLVTVQGVVTADPKDDKIISAAIEAGASYIISEDRHLTDLHAYKSISIMGLDAFAAELDRLGVR